MRVLRCVAALCLVVTACAADELTVAGIETVEDLSVEIVVDEVPGPTQIFLTPDGSIYAGLINGGENDASGQVVRIPPDGGARDVLFDGLDKPTGVVVLDNEVFVMEATRLSSGPTAGGELSAIASDLPNNGRSQGTLTLTPERSILFDTSGSKSGSEVRAGSGLLQRLFPVAAEVEVVADGFKHAYAHVVAPDGSIWTTEMSDGSFDGAPAADELVPVDDAGGGWPLCVGNNRPVAEYGADDCSEFASSRAVFDPGSTPTSVVVSPFDDTRFLVALWLRGQIVSVPMAGTDPTDWTIFASGLSNPQHLAVFDGDLYLSEFGANRILRFSTP